MTARDDMEAVRQLAEQFSPRPSFLDRKQHWAGRLQYIAAGALALAFIIVCLSGAVAMFRAALHSEVYGFFWWVGLAAAFWCGAWWRSYRYKRIAERITARLHDRFEDRLHGQRFHTVTDEELDRERAIGSAVRNAAGKS